MKHWIYKSELRKYYNFNKENNWLIPPWQKFEDYIEDYKVLIQGVSKGIKVIEDERIN